VVLKTLLHSRHVLRLKTAVLAVFFLVTKKAANEHSADRPFILRETGQHER
jgi:hypothetical protein